MTAVPQADSTYNAILTKVRRLTASSGNSSLTNNDIGLYVNCVYTNNFPNAIKTDQMRSVYSFYTAPNIGTYPLNVNYNQGMRSPCYCDGIEMSFFKDRQQFYNMWPKFPTLSFPITGDGNTQQFSFVCSTTPFLPREVTLGGIDTNGNPIRVSDDGQGNLIYNVPNQVIQQPEPPTTAPSPPNTLAANYAKANVPGMINKNTGNPGDRVQYIGSNAYSPLGVTPYQLGTVNYVTGAFAIDFAALTGIVPAGSVTPAAGQNMNLYISQYTTGRPFSLLFWNNEFQIRPIPKLVHKIDIESYLTPVQFMAMTDSPILNQWWQWLAIAAAIKILEDRQDMEGVANLERMLAKEQDLILERQGTEEINQRNNTIFSATQVANGWNLYGSWGGWY